MKIGIFARLGLGPQIDEFLSGLGLPHRIAPQEAVGGAIPADARPATGPLHGRAAGRDASGLPQVVGQLGVSPVGPIGPPAGRAIDHPAADLLGQLGWDRRGMALGLARFQGGEAAIEVSVEPPPDGTGGDAEVGGDVMVLAAPAGQADDLEAVEELAVVGLAEGLLGSLDLGVG